MAAGFLGKAVSTVVGLLNGQVGNIIDQLVADKDLAANLKHQLDLTRLVGQQEIQAKIIDSEKEMEIERERTHQARLQQNDLYTKRARPRIAIESWRLSAVYLISTIGSQIVGAFFNWARDPDPVTGALPPEFPAIAFDPLVFGTIAGPALWFMGVRGLERWKAGGTPAGGLS